jgi:hypothetical protein
MSASQINNLIDPVRLQLASSALSQATSMKY